MLDKMRKGHLALAEAFDAWRIIPRALVAGYAFLVYKVVAWYMDLHPVLMEGCVSENITDCIHQAPTTQHAALVTAVVGMAAVIIGLYSNTGRKWDNGVKEWEKEKKEEESKEPIE